MLNSSSASGAPGQLQCTPLFWGTFDCLTLSVVCSGCSVSGNLKAALRIRQRMKKAGVPMSVHIYNALLAACDGANQFEEGIKLQREMRSEGVQPNTITYNLLHALGAQGVAAVEKQQVAATALAAAVAAAGSIMMRTGVF